MGKFKIMNNLNDYYFYFFSWGYYYVSARALSYKKIVGKLTCESAKSINA